MCNPQPVIVHGKFHIYTFESQAISAGYSVTTWAVKHIPSPSHYTSDIPSVGCNNPFNPGGKTHHDS